MKLKKPVTLTVTDLDVVDSSYDRQNEIVRVTVAVKSGPKLLQQLNVELRKPTPHVNHVNGEPVVVHSCNAVVVRRNPDGAHTTDQFVTQGLQLAAESFDRALAARKAADEFGALETVGVADGWLPADEDAPKK